MLQLSKQHPNSEWYDPIYNKYVSAENLSYYLNMLYKPWYQIIKSNQFIQQLLMYSFAFSNDENMENWFKINYETIKYLNISIPEIAHGILYIKYDKNLDTISQRITKQNVILPDCGNGTLPDPAPLYEQIFINVIQEMNDITPNGFKMSIRPYLQLYKINGT